jgi:hypothetical protein
MATRRSQIQIEVLGMSDLQAMNTALGTHDKRLQQLTATYAVYSQTSNSVTSGTQRLNSQFVTINNTFNTTNRVTSAATSNIQSMGNAAGLAGSQFSGMLGTMLKYRSVSLVFEGVTRTITATFEAMRELEKQAARVQRVSTPGSSPLVRADLAEEAARTGADINDIGEAYYQLKTQIKDNSAAFSALQTSMNLVVGTESDARDVTRAMLQVYNQFGDQLGVNVGQNEKLRRSGELLASMWKGSAAEISEITNALKFLGPIAEAAHVPLEQVAATISALTFEGVRGRMGGTESAQLIGQIIKNFNPANGMISNKGATLQAALTPTGGLDLIQTMRNFNEVASRMPVATAQKFSQAISGTQNAWRLFGTVNPEFLRIIQEKLDDATKATHGLTNGTDDLRKTMTTTEQEWKRAWGGMFSYLGNLIDISPVRGWLHDVGDDLQHILEAMRMVRGLQTGQEQYTQRILTGGGSVREQVATTQPAVQQAFNRLSAYHRLAPWQQLTAGSELDVATKGMTPQERAMISRRYLPGGDTFRQLDMNQMATDLRTMNEQMANPRFGLPPAGLQPANPFSGGNRVKGGYDPPPDKEAEKAANEAARLFMEKLKDQYNTAKAQFDILVGQESEKTSPNYQSPEIVAAAVKTDNLRKQIAKLENDNATRLMMSANREGARVELADKADKAREEALKAESEAWQNAHDASEQMMKARAETTKRDYEIAVKQHGALSPQAIDAAKAADLAERAAASPGELREIQGGVAGTAAAQKDALKEMASTFMSGFLGGVPNPTALQNQYGQNVAEVASDRLSALQRNARSGDIFRNQNVAEEDRLQGSLEIIRNVIDAFEQIPAPSQDIIRLLKEWRDKLLDANAALNDFKDRMAAESYQRRAQSEQDAYSLKTEEINHLHRLKFSKDEDGAAKDTVRKYQELIGAAQDHLTEVKRLNEGVVGGPADDAIRRAVKSVTEAQQNLADFKIDRNIQKYLNVYGPTRNDINAAFENFLHGHGDVGTLARGVGDKIVDAAIESQVKRFTDPLVQMTTKQILSLEGNTDALDALNSTLNGQGTPIGTGNLSDSPITQSVAAGVQSGMDAALGGAQGGAGGSTSSKGRKAGQSDLEKGLGAGFAAYSIGATAAQQGVNAGNLLGSAVTGASIGATFGGPVGAGIGAVVGVAADLIGGLFHHSDKPTAQPRDLNPALYNAPNAFDIGAYNYSMSGILPRLQDVGFDVKPTNAPIVIVNIDGVKQVVNREIGTQTSLGRVSLGNSGGDFGMTPI